MHPFKKLVFLSCYLVFYFLDLLLIFGCLYLASPNLLMQILISLLGLAWCIRIATYKKNWLDLLFQVKN